MLKFIFQPALVFFHNCSSNVKENRKRAKTSVFKNLKQKFLDNHMRGAMLKLEGSRLNGVVRR